MPWILLCLLLAGCGAGAEREALERDRATFLRGNEAWALSLRFEAQAEDGDREAWKVALLRAEDALAYWQAAAATRADWPAARRNVERALLRLEHLRERRREGTKPKDDRRDKDEPPAAPEQDERPPPPKPIETKDLPAERVMGVLDVLARREQARRALRRAQRGRRSASVERDW